MTEISKPATEKVKQCRGKRSREYKTQLSVKAFRALYVYFCTSDDVRSDAINARKNRAVDVSTKTFNLVRYDTTGNKSTKLV